MGAVTTGQDRADRLPRGDFSRTFVSSNPDQDRSRPLFAIQQRFEIRERRMGRAAAVAGGIAASASRFQLPLVFIVMAIHAQQFPVASIGRVVVVIVVPVMDR